MFRRAAVVCIAVLMMAASAAAQEKPYSLAVGGAIVGPLSDSADRFSTGFGFAAGVTWHVNDQIGLTGDYAWSTLGVQDDWNGLVASRPVEVTPRIQFGTVDVRFQAPPMKVRLYVLAGFGLYHRAVRMATRGAGDITVCDPWWFVCTPGPVPVGSVNRTHSSTDPGLNVGAGITAGRLFAEIRYHFMWGPSFDTPVGTQQATGKFLPLIVGVTF
jgi:Outer membrane protein beta-barrel domain